MGTVPETVYVLYLNVLLATSFLLYFYDGHVHVPSLERGHGAATFRYNVYRAHNKQKPSLGPRNVPAGMLVLRPRPRPTM